MNKAEFIKSLEALTEELKNEPQINEETLIKVYKLGWEEAIDYVEQELYENSSISFDEEFNLRGYDGDIRASFYIEREIDIASTDLISDLRPRVEMSKANENFLLGGVIERIEKALKYKPAK